MDYIACKIDKPCPYLDDKEIITCEDNEHWCSGNISADTKCGAEFGVEGMQISLRNTLKFHVPENVLDVNGTALFYS